MERISSLHNPRVKSFVQLSTKSRDRKKQNRFVMEGIREIKLAFDAGYIPDPLFICGERMQEDVLEWVSNLPADVNKIEVSPEVFNKMAYRETTGGLLAVSTFKQHALSALSLGGNPFIIILESVEKPGNLGAVLRTADAAGADAVIICDPLTDLYNPNVIRSSVGCLFSVPVAVSDPVETLAWLKERKINLYAAELNAVNFYHETDFTEPSAIIMGTESDGLTDFWIKNADAGIKIPMNGKIDSLNVSVYTAIITYEAMRQRNKLHQIIKNIK